MKKIFADQRDWDAVKICIFFKFLLKLTCNIPRKIFWSNMKNNSELIDNLFKYKYEFKSGSINWSNENDFWHFYWLLQQKPHEFEWFNVPDFY